VTDATRTGDTQEPRCVEVSVNSWGATLGQPSCALPGPAGLERHLWFFAPLSDGQAESKRVSLGLAATRT
jgi:hypothetical protein